MRTTINITNSEIKSTSTGNMNYILLDEKVKYHFYQNRKDGNPSKAYEQFQAVRPQIGQAIDAEVKIEKKSFTNEKGQLINFEDRFISFFYSDIAPQAAQTFQNIQNPTPPIQTPPVGNQPPNTQQEKPTDYTLSAIKTLTGEIEQLKVRFEAMSQEIAGFRTLLVDLKGKPAVDLHGSSTGKTKGESEEIPIIEPDERTGEDVKFEDNLPK